jgi:hypothetical protein
MAANITSDKVSLAYEQVTIGPEAAALLEFTSDISSSQKRGELTYITSKGAYIWAGVALFIAITAQDKGIEIEDINIHAAIYSAIARNKLLICRKNQSIPGFSWDGPFIKVLNSIYEGADESYLCYKTIRDMLETIGLVSERDRVTLSTRDDDGIDLSKKVNSFIGLGYQELIHEALIIDPIIETTLGLAILSMLPFSYVKRTKKGQLEYKKIQAAAWKYERLRKSGGGVQTNLTFEAARIAKVLKVGIVAAYHQATKGEGDEPEDPLSDLST